MSDMDKEYGPECTGCGSRHKKGIFWIKMYGCSCGNDPYADACTYCLALRGGDKEKFISNESMEKLKKGLTDV